MSIVVSDEHSVSDGNSSQSIEGGHPPLAIEDGNDDSCSNDPSLVSQNEYSQNEYSQNEYSQNEYSQNEYSQKAYSSEYCIPTS